MNAIRNGCSQLKRSINGIMQQHGIGNNPPFAFGLAMDIPNNRAPTTPSLGYESIRDMIADFSIVFGVPKYRTSKPKKVTRKFSFTRLLQPVENLVTCPSCSNMHPSDTICGECYEKVRSLTNDIKKKMMEYNPYVGEKQDKEIYIKFKNDDKEENGEVVNGKRVIEMGKERPSWFKKLTLK